MPRGDGDLIPPAPAPEWSRDGDDFTFRWPALGVEAGVEDVQERSEGWYCEVTFTGHAAHLVWTKLKLDATERRTALITKLVKRYPVDANANGVNWDDILEQLCFIVVRESRKGEPFVDLADVPAPLQLPYLIEPLLPEGLLTVVFGDGEVGKSYFSMFLGVAARTGILLPAGIRPTRQVSVLIADYETQQMLPARRLRRVCAGLGFAEPPRGIHYRRFTRTIADDYRLLAAFISREQIGLVIVDSLAAACGGDPKDAQAAIQTMVKLGNLGVTVLVLAHITKAASLEGGENATIFGSQFFKNYSRATWEVRLLEQPHKDEKTLGLFNRKVNEDERQPDLTIKYLFVPGGGPVRLAEGVRRMGVLTAKQGTMQAQIVEVMESREWWTALEITAELGLDQKEWAPKIAAQLRAMKQGQKPETPGLVEPESAHAEGGSGRPQRWRLAAHGAGQKPEMALKQKDEFRVTTGAPLGGLPDDEEHETRKAEIPETRLVVNGSPHTPLRGREAETTAALRVPRPPQDDERSWLDDIPAF